MRMLYPPIFFGVWHLAVAARSKLRSREGFFLAEWQSVAIGASDGKG